MPESKPAKAATLADQFFRDALDTGQALSLYLVNGFQLKGQVLAFDTETILFKHKGVHQLVLRSAVATMYVIRSSKRGVDEQPPGR
jgi:host factor-I protein|tara:strand:+ start:1385 stop:1642 length:258 start_codon:yes stop_codon:yes gene_type:complete